MITLNFGLSNIGEIEKQINTYISVFSTQMDKLHLLQGGTDAPKSLARLDRNTHKRIIWVKSSKTIDQVFSAFMNALIKCVCARVAKSTEAIFYYYPINPIAIGAVRIFVLVSLYAVIFQIFVCCHPCRAFGS